MSDSINAPKWYVDGGIQTIDYIEAKGLSFHLGNVIKYVSRAGKKNVDGLEDLMKAEWYLNREIDRRIKEKQRQQAAKIPSDE